MKALIVDDSLESRMLLSKILIKSFDAQVIEASQGKAALHKISLEKPDIVFLDYEMPVMNGKETLSLIRAKSEYRNLPVVMVTSHSETELVKELLAYRVSAYLVKPLSIEYVVKRLTILFQNNACGKPKKGT